MALVTPDLIIQPFANNGAKTQPPQTSAAGFVNFQDGYTAYYEISLAANDPNAKPVERAAQNYMFNFATTHAQAWQQMTTAPWYAQMAGGYAKGARVLRVGADGNASEYKSLVNANVDDPLTTPASWEYQPFAYEMIGNIPMPSGGSAGSSGLQLINSTDFNTLGTGTYVLSTDTLAAGSANSPTMPNAPSLAGTLECLAWKYNNDSYSIQRYVDRNGNMFSRGSSNGTYTPWDIKYSYANAQAGAGQFAYTSGSANTYSAMFLPVASALADGMEIRLNINISNTGPSTINVNGIGARTILGQAGQALQGGELLAGYAATLRYSVSNATWRIVNSGAGAIQTGTVTGSMQVPNLAQIQQLIKAAAINQVDWTDVVNKPNVAINAQGATFTSLEMSGTAANQGGQIDFHYNNDSQDFSTRIGPIAAGSLLVSSQASASAAVVSNWLFGPTYNESYLPLFAQQGARVFGNFVMASDANMTAAFVFSCNSNTLTIANSAGAAIASFATINGVQSASFAARPTFNGNLAWDAGNFNPNNKLNAIPGQYNTTVMGSGRVNIASGNWGAISTLSAGQCSFEISNNQNDYASSAMGFVRDGQIELFIGIDLDNTFKLGNNTYGASPLITAANLAAYLPASLASMAYNQIGSYSLFTILGLSTGVGISPGQLLSGGNLAYSSTGWTGSVYASGTWRVMGQAYDGDGSTNSITVCQRVA